LSAPRPTPNLEDMTRTPSAGFQGSCWPFTATVTVLGHTRFPPHFTPAGSPLLPAARPPRRGRQGLDFGGPRALTRSLLTVSPPSANTDAPLSEYPDPRHYRIITCRRSISINLTRSIILSLLESNDSIVERVRSLIQ
jgi:hypothetical protein